MKTQCEGSLLTLLTSDFKEILRREFERRRQLNARYSVRSFARFLEIDFSTLTKVLKGQRKLSDKSIIKIGQKLNMTPSRIEIYLANNKSSGLVDEDYRQIAATEYEIISGWQHYAILELMRLPSFKGEIDWISQVLNIPSKEAKFAVRRLIRTGMIAIEQSGAWVDLTGEKSTNLTPLKTSRGQKKLQRQVLKKAIDALDQIPIDSRDQSSMTMAVDRSLLPEARLIIKKFRRDLAKLLSRNGRVDDVFHLSIGLYPVTNLFNGVSDEVFKNSVSDKSNSLLL